VDAEINLSVTELRNAWRLLDVAERVDGYRLLDSVDADTFFEGLSTQDQLELLLALPEAQRRLRLRVLAPDDITDLLQQAPDEHRAKLVDLLEPPMRREVVALLAYAEDDAGGLMSPRFARVRPEMTVEEAILYLRRQASERLETIYYGYVLDREQRLLGVVSFRDLFMARGASLVREIMRTDTITAPSDMDQEALAKLFAAHDLVALPIVDAAGVMKGIVTVDDIVDVVQEEATEDFQKIGGTVALEAPYLQVAFWSMFKKRAGWMIVLFIGEMLTISVMAGYEAKLEQMVILAVFLPLIISSGGNSGGQASTLVIRAMALGEVRMRDWTRVLMRELAAGLSLGGLLGVIGLATIFLRGGGGADDPLIRVALTVSISVVGVVLWGTLVGSMLPLLLRKAGFDPASASAPLVATLVDVTGLVVYFLVGDCYDLGTS
jgi:magnesium transporter